MFGHKGKEGNASLRRKLWIATMFLICALSSRGGRDPSSSRTRTRWKSQAISKCRSNLSRARQAGETAFSALRLSWNTEFRAGGQPELYLDGQSTTGESTIFTGYRLENRFRIVPGEHWINPVLYVEFENINGADRTLLEVVGHDGETDLTDPNDEARREKKREIEAKLILSSHFQGWTVAENFIAEKNVRHQPYEFGYAVGISRPLSLIARPEKCEFCRENFQAGVEVYGGLGTHSAFGLNGTSQYVAPTLAWTSAGGGAFRISPSFGVTQTSARFLLRVSATYEIAQFGRAARKLFRASGTQ